MAQPPRRRDMPNPGMPSIFQQLSVLPPAAKAFVGSLMVLMGIVAVTMVPETAFSWVLLVLGLILGLPLAWQGFTQAKEHQLVTKELERAALELDILRLELEQATADKRGIERFLMDRGYTTAKARRWIALECDVVLPASTLH
tara:strand:+ start:1971 stop:2399 length:429 start_codon:yes stop_codon:yes gene_type:complete